MKHPRPYAMIAAALLVTHIGFTHAQSTKPPLESSRMAAFMDRDTFLAMHRWDEMTGLWVLKSGVEIPKGILPRSDVMAMADSFLAKNTWNDQHSLWVSNKATPRDMSKLSREEARIETIRFLMTHQFDEATGEWVSKTRTPN